MKSPLIPADALNQHIAILGKTGSGKTTTAKVAIVEPLIDSGAHVCIIDPTSAWWGLRLSADGKRPVNDRIIIIGGERGDIGLSPNSGAAVARLVTEQGASVIVDTGGLTVGESTRWMIDFAGTLYTSVKGPLHLILDEAHNFAPQSRTNDVDGGKMLNAVNKLMSGGRSRGIRGTLITQRPAKLHKDSLTCCDSLLAHRVIAPQDRSAIKDWVDGCGDATTGRQVMDSLAQLAKGECWVWYPEGGHLQRVKMPMPKTYDSSKAPEVGKRAPSLGAIDLGAVKASMEEAIKEAEANDPKRLRARIVELERHVLEVGKVAQERGGFTPVEIQNMVQAEAAKQVEPLRQTIAALAPRVKAALDYLGSATNQLTAHLEFIQSRASELPPAATPRMVTCYDPPKGKTKPRTISDVPLSELGARSEARIGATVALDGVGKAHQKILDALAWWEAMGHAAPTRVQVFTIAGYTANGYSERVVGECKSAGLLVYPTSGTVSLSDSGRRVAAPCSRPSLREAHDRARGILSSAQRKLFDAILSAGEISREAVFHKLGMTANGYTERLVGELKTLQLITYPSTGKVAIAEWLIGGGK